MPARSAISAMVAPAKPARANTCSAACRMSVSLARRMRPLPLAAAATPSMPGRRSAGAEHAVAGVAQARARCSRARSAAFDPARRVHRHVGVGRCSARRLRAHASRQTNLIDLRRRFPSAGSTAAMAELPVASIGSTTITSRSRMSSRHLEVVLDRRRASSGRGTGRYGRRARAGTTISMPSRMPLPARRIDTRHSFLPSMTGAFIVRQRRLDLDSLSRQVARDLVGQQLADLAQQAAEAVGAGVLVAHQVSLCWTSGWSIR